MWDGEKGLLRPERDGRPYTRPNSGELSWGAWLPFFLWIFSLPRGVWPCPGEEGAAVFPLFRANPRFFLRFLRLSTIIVYNVFNTCLREWDTINPAKGF